MLNYNKLFDILYSETLPESVKCEVIDRVNSKINESELFSLNEAELNPMTSFVSSLIESNISEETLYEVLNMTFESVSEEVINEVSDELRKKAAQEVLSRRRTEAAMAEVREKENKAKRMSSDTKPIGLAGIRREANIRQSEQDRVKADKRLQHAEKVAGSNKSALSRLKSTAGKMFREKESPIGLARPLGWKAPKSAPQATPKSAPKQEAPQSAPKADTGATETAGQRKRREAESRLGRHIGTGNTLAPESPGQRKRREAEGKLGQRLESGSTITPESPGQRKRREAEGKLGQHLTSGPTIETGTTKEIKKAKKVKTTEAPKSEADKKVETSKEKAVKKVEASKEKAAKKVKASKSEADKKVEASKEKADKKVKASSEKADKKIKASSEKADKKTQKAKATEAPKPEVVKNPFEEGTLKYYQHIVDNSTNEKQKENARKKISKLVAKDTSTAEKAKKLKTRKKAGEKVTNEALSEVILSLVNSTISESSFSEILEMISNKKAAEKAVDREEKNLNKKLDALNKAEETKAKTGVDPLSTSQREELTKEAEKAGSRYETFRRLANNKYNLNK